MNAVYGSPWCITGDGWMSVHHALQSHLAHKSESPQSKEENGWKSYLSDSIAQRPDMEIDKRGIAHIHVFGVLGPKLTKLEKACGTTDYGELSEELAEARENARGVMLHIDSPGGYAQGNMEAAYALAETARAMPVVAHTDGMMCSAAYAIGVGASSIFATPSADVGSIGVIIPLVDRSGQWEQQGIKPAYITHTGGDLKDAGYPPSFTQEHIEFFQTLVDDTFGLFRAHVLNHRDVSAEAMRGQYFMAERAQSENLIDEVGSPEEAYDFLLSRI